MSAQVAEALVPQLTGDERLLLAKRGTDNAEAFEAYLRGRYHWNSFTEDGFAKAITSYYRAIALDPSYAAAYTGIADYYNWIGIFGVLPPAECFAAAKDAATKAVELDDTLAEAHAALGFAVHTHDLDWQGAKSHYRRAFEINPNYAAPYLWFGLQLTMECDFDEGLPATRRALALDPLSLFNHHIVGWCLFYARRYQESIAEYRKLIDTDPQYGLGYFGYSWSLAQLGEHTESIRAARKAIELSGPSPFIMASLGSAYAAAGKTVEARRVLGELEELATRRYVSPYHLALVYAQLGDKRHALDLLEQSFTNREAWVMWLAAQPQLDSLRGDARFEAIIRRTGNPVVARPAGETTGEHGVARDAARDTSSPAPRPTEDEEAYQLYVAGRYFSTRRTAEGLRQAVERFERAVAQDPNFALAHAELADCYALMNWYVEPPPDDAWERAREAAQRAVEADDSLAEAHASYGFVKMHYDRDWPGAEQELRRAVELNPDNPVPRRWHAFNLSAMARHEEALSEVLRAQELSPRSPVAATAVANVLFFAQRFDEAIGQCRKALELDPGSLSAHIVLRWCYERVGMCEEALAVYEQERAFAGDTPTTRAKRAHVLASCGQTAEAREILSQLISRREREWVTAYEVAVIYSLLGERDEAFEWLALAEREHAVGFTFFRVDPRINNLRSDQRFAELLRRTNYEPEVVEDESDAPENVENRAADEETGESVGTAAASSEAVAGAVVAANGSRAGAEDARALSAAAQPSGRWTRARVAVALAVVLVVVGLPAVAYLKGFRWSKPAVVYPLRLTNNIVTDWQPHYSPDGEHVIFASNRDGNFEIYVMNADGTEPSRLTNNSTEDLTPVWSPDSSKIAFVSKRDGNDEVYVMDADGSNQTNLTRHPSADSRPTWSPDGKRIAFVSNRDGQSDSYDIYSMRADGSEPTRITADPAFDGDPAWSPDGKRIAFASNRTGNFEIFLMDADGQHPSNVSNNPAFDGKPAWSPDGKSIAFISNRDPDPGDFDVYTMGADGGNARKITNNTVTDDGPQWSPDGEQIIYQTEQGGNIEIYVNSASPESQGGASQNGKKSSVAVLPLTTIGAEGDAQYLGVGIADMLTNKLGQLDEVMLRSSGAVRRYLGTKKSALEAGRELGVDYVLAGTVERIGDHVQTSLELTETAGGRVMWAEKFNEPFTDIPALQNSISERVARALRIELTNDERRRLAKRYTDNSEAQQLYLAGRYHWGKRTPDGLRQAIANFEQAIAKDSRFALAYAGIADCNALLNWYLEPPPPEAWERAKQAALRAVEFDEQLAEAHVSLAFIKFHYDRDWTGAEDEFKRAISLNHNYPTAHHWYAFNLSAMGRHEEALAEIKRAQELDPRSPVIATAVANVLFHARRYDEAVEACRKALELDPGSVSAHVVLRWAYEKKGMNDAAFAIYEKERAFAGDTPTTRAKLAHVLAAGGRTNEARKIVQELVAARKEQWVTPYEIAVIYSLIGDRDSAFRWLAEAEREHVVGFTFFRVDPHLENLHGDPRFAQLLR
jgi:tetratricopeptide (TPR) repeat protein